MSWFDIHLTQVAAVRGHLDSVKDRISALEGQMRSIQHQIDRHMSESGQIDPALETTKENLRRRRISLENLSESLTNIIRAYQDAENNVLARDMPAIPSWAGRQLSVVVPGYHFSNPNMCPNPITNGGSAKDHPNSQDPVNLSNGNFIDESVDLDCGKGLVFRRFYNSLGNDGEGMLGRNWICNVECRIRFDRDQGHDIATVTLEDGQEFPFVLADDGSWYVMAQSAVTLEHESDRYTFTATNHSRRVFDEKGRFLRYEDVSHTGFDLSYGQDREEAEGRLVQVTSDHGGILNLEYDDAGYLRCVTDSTGRVFSYFVSGGLLLHTEAPDGAAWTYGYTDDGLLKTSMDPEGNLRVQNTYDDQYRVTEQIFADNSVTRFAYDDEKNCVIETERDGSVRTYYHDEDGKVYRIAYPDGEWQCEYDDRGNRILTKDRNGNITRFSYDTWGNISKEIRADGSQVDMTYGAHSRPVQIKMNGVIRMRNSFDENGNLVRSEDALGRHADFEYREGRLVSTTLQDGAVLQITYDADGNVTGITLPNGGRMEYTYDELARVTAVRDPNGNVSRLEYDLNGNIISRTNADGGRLTYVYDRNGNVVKASDPAGNTWERHYNALNLPDSDIDAAGRKTAYTYDAMWNIATVTSPAGAVTAYEYDQNNRLSRIQDAEGGEVRYTYDANGNRISETDAEGSSTRYDYDEMGRLVQVVSGQSALLLEYDADGNIAAVTDAAGGRVEMTYDAAGQRISEKTTEGAELRYTYDPFGNVASVEDENGNRTEYIYGPGGEGLVSVRYPEGATEHYEYDLNGNMIRSVDAAGKETAYCYDAMNRVIERAEGGLIHHYTYDALGRLLRDEDSEGGHTEYVYSVTGQLTQITDTLGNKAIYTYDADDHLIRVEQTGDPKEPARFTEYTRDLLGRLLSVTDANGRTEQFTYNRRGNLVSRLDPDGLLTRYEYAENNLLHHVSYADGRDVYYAYDALAAVREITDWNGTTSVENNQSGQPVKVTYPDGSMVGYSYDKNGRMTEMFYPDGTRAEYRYDLYGRLSAVLSGDQIYQYHYDAAGRLTEKDIPGKLKTTYTFNALNQLTSMVSSDEQGELDSDTFTYDLYGRKTGIRRSRRGMPEQSGLFTFGYDALHRLTSVERDGVQLREYQYDAFSNRTLKQEYLGGVDRQTSYEYDAANQLLREITDDAIREYSYDGRGNLTGIAENGSSLYQYEYDAAGRLASAVNPEGLRARYYYNGLGARIGRDVYRGEERTGKVRYARDISRVFHNLLSSAEENSREDYLYDYGPIGMLKAAGDENPKLYSYLSDHTGSPFRFMDSDGTELDSFAYDEFGAPEKRSSDLQPFGYTGYMPDDIAGTYYAQAREYLPGAGIFAARDLVPGDLLDPQGLNRYRYADNDPEDYVDNNGQFAVTTVLLIMAIGAAAGAVVSGGSNAIEQAIAIHRDPSGNTHFNGKVLLANIFGGAIGGFINGGAAVATGGASILLKGVGAGAGSFFTDIFTDMAKGESINWAHAGEDAVISGVVGAAFAGVSKWFKGTSVGKWFTNVKKNIFGLNAMDKLKLADKLDLVKQNHKDMYDKYIRHALGGLVVEKTFKSIGDILKKGFEKMTGFKKPKDIIKDLLKSWCPWYQDPTKDKTMGDYFKDYWNGIRKNAGKILGNLRTTSPWQPDYSGGGSW